LSDIAQFFSCKSINAFYTEVIQIDLYINSLENIGDREMIDTLLMIVPTVLTILSLIAFNEKTRWYCYTLVTLSVASELIPIQINAIALAATCSALAALIAMDLVHRMKAPKAAAVKY